MTGVAGHRCEALVLVSPVQRPGLVGGAKAQASDRGARPIWPDVLAPRRASFNDRQVAWGVLALDAHLVASVLGDPCGAPSLYACNIQFGESHSNHQSSGGLSRAGLVNGLADRRTEHGGQVDTLMQACRWATVVPKPYRHGRVRLAERLIRSRQSGSSSASDCVGTAAMRVLSTGRSSAFDEKLVSNFASRAC